MKAQLKAANKVLALKKKLAAAPPAKKDAIRAKIAVAKAKLAKATRKVLKVSNRIAAKKLLIVKQKLSAAKDPQRRAALKK